MQAAQSVEELRSFRIVFPVRVKCAVKSSDSNDGRSIILPKVCKSVLHEREYLWALGSVAIKRRWYGDCLIAV